MEKKVGFSNKLMLLRERLYDPEWRRYGYLLLGGKVLGLVLLLGIIGIATTVIGSDVMAADPVITGNNIVNPVNTLWTLLAAFLVFGMQEDLLFLPRRLSGV